MPKDNIQRAIDRGTGEGADAAAIERVTLRGLRPGRRRDPGRGADRQPQPHRRRGPPRLRAGTAAASASPGSVAWHLREARRDRRRRRALQRGRPDARRSTPAPRTSREDGDLLKVTTSRLRPGRRARGARGGRGRGPVGRADDGARRARSRSRRPTRPRCCGSSTPSTSTTTSTPCTPTSTFRRRSWRRRPRRVRPPPPPLLGEGVLLLGRPASAVGRSRPRAPPVRPVEGHPGCE